MGYFHKAAQTLVPTIGEIEPIVSSKHAFSLKIGNKEFRLNRVTAVSRLGFIRRLGAMLGEVDNLMSTITRGASLQAKAKEFSEAGNPTKAGEFTAEAYAEFTFAAPKIIAALCNEKFEALVVECAKNAMLKKIDDKGVALDFQVLQDDTILEEAIDGDVSVLIALGLCYLEVTAQDFLKQVAGTIQSRLRQTDVSINTFSPPSTNELKQ